MGLTKEVAFSLLEVPSGSDQEAIKTQYKKLALKWHPEKHSNAPDAVKRFRQITQAYRLLAFNNSQEMTVADARKFFQEVYFENSCVANGASEDSTSSEDDETDDSEEDEMSKIELQFGKFFPVKVKDFQRKKESVEDSTQHSHLTAEEINRNAEELITEEEKERRKADKRRAKKKRRKERKKFEKQEQKKDKGKSKNGSVHSEDSQKPDKQDLSESSSDDQADFDANSAFFTKAISKKKKAAPDTTQTSKKDSKNHEHNGTHVGEEEVEVDSTVLRSRQLAIRGNEMAQVEEYNAAIQLFTEAISLDPKDFRFLGNRSYCYDRLQQYEKALKDAEKAIKLSKDWPKGYFRKGRALAGLSRFSEAEEAFLQVLKLDKNCEEAVLELQQVRTRQLTDMGFSYGQALAAIKKHSTVQAALEALLASGDDSLAGEVYVSDEEDYTPTPKSIPSLQLSQQQAADVKMDPKNPEGLTALWVGNVLPQVTERRLTQLFSKYGPVLSVRMLPEKYCAFINFKLKESAGRAMQGLQNKDLEGQHLLIRFPDNPVDKSGNITIRKTPAQASPTTTTTTSTSPTAAASSKAKGKQGRKVVF